MAEGAAGAMQCDAAVLGCRGGGSVRWRIMYTHIMAVHTHFTEHTHT